MSNSPVELTLLGLGTPVPRKPPLLRQTNKKSNSKKYKNPVGTETDFPPTKLLQGWGDPPPPPLLTYSRYGQTKT
jgi:hypothetical protein